ncbi:glycosyl transferase [Clostridium botulinum]|uniref:glycosyltransferase n=1 Tax=Clostridium botulinum TaxID=1491 RepID=UPI00077489FC|nr:glycosyltransferase [Clostridium botulinum]NFL87191.1 glycosyl transferase [Clostridium botulinum]NFO22389.1 glycosyl transferase [Clostridium botulinum]
MIPKIIHYCWFGKKPLPKFAKKCINSWKKYCPDYKIIEWNEDNFDLSCNTYVKEAYESEKWAFVTDYVRLYALFTMGGIYMDTDVEVIKPLDLFLNDNAFSGFECEDRVPTGIMGAEKNHKFIKTLMQDYRQRKFVNEDGKYDCTTNVVVITQYCIKQGLKLDGTKQIVCDFTLYPSEYFCPKNYRTKVLNITKNTCAIHHFDGSWLPLDAKIRTKFIELIGCEWTNRLRKVKHKLNL